MNPVIGFAGMSHLGIVSAAAAAAHGFRTVCFDPAEARLQALAAGRLPVFEPGLDPLYRAHGPHFEFTADPAVLGRCDVIYLAADVATDDSGVSDLAMVRALLKAVMAAPSRSVLVVLSQVPPGFTRKLADDGRPVFYQVETLVFGDAVERALHPERIIVGCADPAAPLAPAYAAFLAAFDCPVLPMRYESAELAKISINCLLAASVSTANMLAELCERIGANWSEVVPALRLDRRIGAHAYLQAGLGLSGGNLERDLASVRQLAAEAGTDAALVTAWIANSHHRRDWALRILHRTALAQRSDCTIGLLGLAYKEDTHSSKNSAALALIDALPCVRFQAYDPGVPADAAGRPNVRRVADALDAVQGADAVALMTPWPAFRTLDPASLAARMAGRVVVDPYGLLDADACRRAGLERHRLGTM